MPPSLDVEAKKYTDMLNMWDYSGVGMVCYSDVNQESYKKSAEFLGGETVEDWGCGTGWSKKYFKNYRGIDGSYHPNVDEVVDIANYTSNVDNILIRQCLEFNYNWRQILDNVKASFNKKFCLVVMTPLVSETRIESITPIPQSDGSIDDKKQTPDIFFNKQDIIDYFPEKEGYIVTDETISVNGVYPNEWILYVEKIS